MSQELIALIDVERRTTRGRACPRCGGKIIPSIRAVYQAADPDESFPIWQCERCGYEEMSAKKGPAAKAKHAPAATASVSSQQLVPTAKAKVQPPMLDAKGRALPPDVKAMMLRFGDMDNKSSESST